MENRILGTGQMTDSGGIRPVTVWCAVGIDGTRIYKRNATQAEQASIKMGANALDVVPMVVHRSKDGVIAALNEAAVRVTK